MVWYGMVGPDQSLATQGGQRLLLRVILLAPNQIIVRLNLGPRIALGEVEYRLKIKGGGDYDNTLSFRVRPT